MGIFSASVVFFISWWLVFLAVLPIGVQGQHESHEAMEEGTDPGAPQEAMLGKKALWATIGAVSVTLIAFLIAVSGIIQKPEPIW